MFQMGNNIQCSTIPSILQSRMGKIMIFMIWVGKFFYNHIEIACVTCLNILKMGIRTRTMKSATADTIILVHCHANKSATRGPSQ